MNDLGEALVWCSLRVTLLGAVGIAVHVFLRRGNPATGAQIASRSLIALVALPLLALSPWPRWCTVDPDVWLAKGGRQDPNDALSLTGSQPTAPRKALVTSAKRTVGVSPNRENKSERSTPQRPTSKYALRPGAFQTPARGNSGPRTSKSTDNWTSATPVIVHSPPRSPSVDPETSRLPWRSAIASVFLAGVALGFIRLLAGIWAVERLRARSVPILDRSLGALVETLRVEMGLSRRAEIRESMDISTPATVSWRRPLLLLPIDWYNWTLDERRAVFAHELAHIGRNDYLAWLGAQLSLALHFYHPFVHWLVGRLRLEQELAADDEAARYAGGHQFYLETLARMALRQDVRPAAWPVRSFFPVRGTFLRRIEMLRKANDHPRQVASPWATRTLTFALILNALLLVAGLRGPNGNGPGVALASPTPRADKTVTKPAPKGLDLAHVPDDAALVVAFKPAALVKRPEIRTLMNMALESAEARQFLELARADTIDQATVVLPRQGLNLLAGGGEMALLSGGLILHSSTPRDWKSSVAAILPGTPLLETRYAGQPYYSIRLGEGQNVGFFLPDDHTVVAAAIPSLFSFMTKSKGTKPAWAEAWKSVENAQVAVAADVGSIRGLVEPLLLGDLMVGTIAGTFSPLWEETSSLVFGIDGEEGLKLDLLAVSPSEEGVVKVERTLQAILTLTTNSTKAFTKLLRLHAEAGGAEDGAKQAAAFLLLNDLCDSLISSAKVERSGSIVHLQTSTKENVGRMVQMLMIMQ
jgi:beta-lactamase regulating signal transducer with metallopeptidase domain